MIIFVYFTKNSNNYSDHISLYLNNILKKSGFYFNKTSILNKKNTLKGICKYINYNIKYGYICLY